MLNCRVHRGAELETDHYLLVGSCRLYLSQPHAPKLKSACGYDSSLLHDADAQQKYADLISTESHHMMYSMVTVPNSPPEAVWQQYKSGLQRCADALLRKQPQPRTPWMSERTWARVQSKQDSYKAMKHALSEHERPACQRQYRQVLSECKESVKAAAFEADLAANRLHSAYKRVGLRDELDRVQFLAAGKLRRSVGSHTSNSVNRTGKL